MLPLEFERMYNILASFLGEAKSRYSASAEPQYQFPCPRCVEEKGIREASKFNLECHLGKGVFHCWSCSADGDDEMKGTILKLIKMYGNTQLYREYKECVNSLRDSSLYSLTHSSQTVQQPQDVELPCGFRPFRKDKYYPEEALEYLQERGIDWSIINDFSLGFTTDCKDDKKASKRIILPSNDEFGTLNYWTGRDYTGESKQKYMNPKVDRKTIIFNEEKVQWDADVTLVEGPFDHLVVPNSVPMLGKALDTDYKLYWDILKKSRANINVFVDGDAYDSAKEIYSLLNHGRLYGKIRYIPVDEHDDPSSLFQHGGRREILYHLKHAEKISETEL